jgi:hypothetical protein
MAIHTDFYMDINFGGDIDSFALDNNWRYWWVVFGSKFRDNISSFRSTAYGGTDGNAYAFTQDHFLGTFLELNMQEGWTSWWSYVGDALNDQIESAILVNRNKNELVTGLKDQIAGDFASGMDAQLAGTQVSRKGDPRIYTTFWPGYDPDKTFVSIEQDLNVALDWWPDYDAQVRYDIYLYLDGAGTVQGYVAWVYVWVEGGIFSGDIFDSLQPKLVDGAATLTSRIQEKLAIFSSFHFSSLYLLPGPSPSGNFGDIHDAKEDSTLVLWPKPF